MATATTAEAEAVTAMEVDEKTSIAPSTSNSNSVAAVDLDDDKKNDDDDDDDDIFERLASRPRQGKRKKKSHNKKKRNKTVKVSINVPILVNKSSTGARSTSDVVKINDDTVAATATATATSTATTSAAGVDVDGADTNHPQEVQSVVEYPLLDMNSIYNDDIYNNNDDDDDDNDDGVDFLSFYEETHEEQDPVYIAHEQEKQRHSLQQQLHHLEQVIHPQGRQEIETFITDLLQEKQASAERSVEQYKERATKEELALTNKLQAVYLTKTTSHQRKITTTLKFLQQRQQKEVAAAMKQHQQQQQQQQQRGQQQQQQQQQSQQRAAAEWQQILQKLQGKHQAQLQELNRKADEVKRKLDADYKREADKIIKSKLQKFADIDGKRQKLVQQFLTHFTTLRQRYLKRHFQRVLQQKQDILQKQEQLMEQQQENHQSNKVSSSSSIALLDPSLDETSLSHSNQSASSRGRHGATTPPTPPVPKSPGSTTSITTTPREIAKSAMEDNHNRNKNNSNKNNDKEELRPTSPLKSLPDWLQEQQQQQNNNSSQQRHQLMAGAAARHKHRKSVMSHTNRQLSVEIHNEGLWILTGASARMDEDQNNNKSSNSTTTGTAGDDKKDSNKYNPHEQTFMAWGLQAYTVLESIVCGEIPKELERLDFGMNNSNNGSSPNNPNSSANITMQMGGQVRCVVTDLRTSHETASSQRAAALRQLEESAIYKLELAAKECTHVATEAEKQMMDAGRAEKEAMAQLDAATKDVGKAKRIQDEFNNKFRSFIGPDGNPLPTTNPNDRNELLKAMMRYKNNCESTVNKQKAARQNLDDIRSKQVTLQANAKTALKNATYMASVLKKKKQTMMQDNSTRSSASTGSNPANSRPIDSGRGATRVKDVIEALRKTAERRREQLNQKKDNSFSSAWIQSFPNLPMAMKKSLWHKMHRRKQQIVLRPSTGIVDELRMRVAEVTNLAHMHTEATTGSALSMRQRKESVEEEMLKAEQLYLLACHPPADPERASVPPMKSSESWAEPGWQLDLSVPEKRNSSDRILPCAPSFPLLEKNLSEMASAPGRQAANFMRPSVLRTLAVPLSAVAIASSPAEITASVSRPRELSEGDPLLIRDDELKNGYTFSLTPPVPKGAAAQARRKDAPITKPSVSSVKPAPAAAAVSTTSKTNESKQQQRQQPKAKSTSSAGSIAASDKPKPTQAKRRRSTKSQDGPSKRKKQESTTASSSKAASANSSTGAVKPSPRSRKATVSAVQASNVAPTHTQQQQRHLQAQQAYQQQQQMSFQHQQQLQAQQQQMQQQQRQQSARTPAVPPSQPKQAAPRQQQARTQQYTAPSQPPSAPRRSPGQQQQQQQQQQARKTTVAKPSDNKAHRRQPQPKQQRSQTQQQQPQPQPQPQPHVQQRHQQQQQLQQQPQQSQQQQQPQRHPQQQQAQQQQQFVQQQQQYRFGSPQQRQQMAQAQQLRMMQNAAAAAAARGGPQGYAQAMAQMAPPFYAPALTHPDQQQQSPHGGPPQFQPGISQMHMQAAAAAAARGGGMPPGAYQGMPMAGAVGAVPGQQQGVPMQGPGPGQAQLPQQQQQQQQGGNANQKDQNDPLFMLK